MVHQEYVCDECGYAYTGCGGLDFSMNARGKQTVSCKQCETLQDVPLGVSFYDILTTSEGRERQRAMMMERIAAITLLCTIEPWHAVRPWADSEHRVWNVPEALVGVCPRCGGHMRAGGVKLIFN